MKDLRALLDAIVPDPATRGLRRDPLAPIRNAAQGLGNVTKAQSEPSSASSWYWKTRAATKFFGEPALALKDFMRTDRDGRGMVNILVADKLMQSPRLYATFLLWMLSELFEELPEVGDPPKPKLVFFFDEAHLLFNDAPKALMDKIEQVVRLIRSKGVGVYFVTQNPIDVPDKVLGQLGNRVQHALAGLHPARPEGGRGRGADVPAQSEARHRQGHHGIGQGRSAGVVPGRQRHAGDGRARHDPAAVGADRTDHAGGTQGDHGHEPGEGQIRHRDRFRIRL